MSSIIFVSFPLDLSSVINQEVWKVISANSIDPNAFIESEAELQTFFTRDAANYFLIGEIFSRLVIIYCRESIQKQFSRSFCQAWSTNGPIDDIQIRDIEKISDLEGTDALVTLPNEKQLSIGKWQTPFIDLNPGGSAISTKTSLTSNSAFKSLESPIHPKSFFDYPKPAELGPIINGKIFFEERPSYVSDNRLLLDMDDSHEYQRKRDLDSRKQKVNPIDELVLTVEPFIPPEVDGVPFDEHSTIEPRRIVKISRRDGNHG